MSTFVPPTYEGLQLSAPSVEEVLDSISPLAFEPIEVPLSSEDAEPIEVPLSSEDAERIEVPLSSEDAEPIEVPLSSEDAERIAREGVPEEHLVQLQFEQAFVRRLFGGKE